MNMCGIVGIFNSKNAVKKATAALDIMENRGKDGRGLFYDSGSVLGHCLHSVVGFVKQPIKKKGIIAANCEIYNWKELALKHKLTVQNDSELLIELIEKKGIKKLKEILEELDGVYAFAYWNKDGKNNKVIICRDILGEKPLWFFSEKGVFAFASERKALERTGFSGVREVNPREIIEYDITEQKLRVTKRGFYSTKPALQKTKKQILKELTGLVINAVAKRIPDQRFGILFSGGVDSVLIAQVCKKLGVDFICYTAAVDSEKKAEDLVFAEKAAETIGLKLHTIILRFDEVEEYVKKVVSLIEDNNVVKIGVGLPFYAACEQAKLDGINVVFSGLGSEELFAGYERHKNTSDVNDECVSGLLKMYERDLYRDDVITMNNSIELRLPFLDKKLAEYSLRIPAKYKLDEKQNKKILREAATALGVPEEFAQRKKRAAQYGSNFDKALERLARRNGFKSKSEYLNKFYSRNPVLGVLFSSGKDSAYAMWIMKKQNYPIKCLITIKSRNPDSYMYHTPNVGMVELQAKAMNLPLVVEKTEGIKEKELDELKTALSRAKKEHGIEGVVTGALYSQYQRQRIEAVCDSLGLKIFSPLWHMDQEKELREIIKEGFKIVLSSVAAEGLDGSWLGRQLGEKDVDKLVELNRKNGLNVAGEGGEFESLVLDGPMFEKRIEIEKAEVAEESENAVRFMVKKARLVEKKV
jgi:asparagine synthase (glutamine-hydrolysing)